MYRYLVVKVPNPTHPVCVDEQLFQKFRKQPFISTKTQNKTPSAKSGRRFREYYSREFIGLPKSDFASCAKPTTMRYFVIYTEIS